MNWFATDDGLIAFNLLYLYLVKECKEEDGVIVHLSCHPDKPFKLTGEDAQRLRAEVGMISPWAAQ